MEESVFERGKGEETGPSKRRERKFCFQGGKRAHTGAERESDGRISLLNRACPAVSSRLVPLAGSHMAPHHDALQHSVRPVLWCTVCLLGPGERLLKLLPANFPSQMTHLDLDWKELGWRHSSTLYKQPSEFVHMRICNSINMTSTYQKVHLYHYTKEMQECQEVSGSRLLQK